MLAPVRNDRLLVTLAIVVGIVLIVIAVVYWARAGEVAARASSPATRPAPTTTT